MASLEKKTPFIPDDETGSAEQAGVFLETAGQSESRVPLLDLGSYVLHDAVSLLTERDPLSAIQRVKAASNRYGDDMRMLAEPGGKTYIFITEAAHDRFLQKEADRIEAEIKELQSGSSPEIQD